MLLYVYLIAITAEAMSGALAAGKRNMDLFGVALISGIQLWRGRGSEEVDGGRYADLSRKERRRARRTDKAVQAAERKTATEIDKAEKRAAKLAPDPDPVARPAMVDGPPTLDSKSGSQP